MAHIDGLALEDHAERRKEPGEGYREALSVARRTEFWLALALLVGYFAASAVGGAVTALITVVAIAPVGGEYEEQLARAEHIFYLQVFVAVVTTALVPLIMVRVLPRLFERWQLNRVVRTNSMPPDVAPYQFARVSPYVV